MKIVTAYFGNYFQKERSVNDNYKKYIYFSYLELNH